jgi:hypothetical protein
MNQTFCRGEDVHFSKLTEEEVRDILKMGRNTTGRNIAEFFGVSPSAISHILLRKTWKHVTV